MPAPAIVMGDKITGMCPMHQIPGPVGNPQPAPPMPFSAPLTWVSAPRCSSAASRRPSSARPATNTPPHVGLHPADPFMVPPMQVGHVSSGSPTVLFEGKPAVNATRERDLLRDPGSLVPTVTTVMVG